MDEQTGSGECKIPEVYCCCKGFKFCDGKHTKKTLATTEVVISYGCIVLLSSCVQNINLHLLSVEDHFLPVAVGFSGLIVFNKLWEERKWTLTNQIKIQPIYCIIKEMLLYDTLDEPLHSISQCYSSLFCIVNVLLFVMGFVCLFLFQTHTHRCCLVSDHSTQVMGMCEK